MTQPLPTSDVGTNTASDVVEAWLAHCRPLLPLQNPLWAFVHNNVLQAFERLPFHEAMREAAALYEARPYESEAFYREELTRGRLRREDLDQVLREAWPLSGDERVVRFLTDPAMGTHPPKAPPLRLARRLDGTARATYDRRLHDFLVPLVASYFDQGMAGWSNPFAEGSLWAFFRASVETTPAWGFDWARALRAQLTRHEGLGPQEVVRREVEALAPKGSEADWCLETLFLLRGWSGIVHRLEVEPSLAPVSAPPGSLVDWLAALLVATHALDDWMRSSGLASESAPTFDPLPRLALWHEAYERSFAGPFLSHLERGLSAGEPASPSFQALVCMDDREESLRRALEAPEVGVHTWGVVGFFGIDMSFRGVGTSRPTRQCPPVIEPSRTVTERPVGKLPPVLDLGQRLAARARLAGFYNSRTLIRGFLVSLLLGVTSYVPMLLHVMLPRRLGALRRRLVEMLAPHPPTEILLDAPGAYSVEERADVVESILRTSGCTGPFAPVIGVVGHESSSTNNPFRQAYGCGACSGNSGRPNARAFAQMANDPGVRQILLARGLEIPASSLFVPFIHDTAADEVTLLDPHVHAYGGDAVEELHRRLSLAARRSAVERTRRFAQAPPDADEAAAAAHVLERAHDPAQPRPEYGHSRVAACVVGRRGLTRASFLDRRAFLVSYDPTRDPDGRWLRSAVLGSVPVAVNIAMDYYCSRVDPERFGAGSKLPLNVVSLLGVYTGSKSDLRIGLARQMVELHEPMRILVLLETSAERLHALVMGHPRMKLLVEGGWMRLGRIDPDSRAIELWREGALVRWRDALIPGDDGPLPSVLDLRHDRPVEAA